jgi:hypothetical protein
VRVRGRAEAAGHDAAHDVAPEMSTSTGCTAAHGASAPAAPASPANARLVGVGRGGVQGRECAGPR